MTDIITVFKKQPDLHQSPMYAALMRSINWLVEQNRENQVFIRQLGPIAIAKIQRPGVVDWGWLREVRRRHHALTTYIEPGLLTLMPPQPGLKVEPLAHSETSLLDLRLSDKELLTSFSQKTRYNITRNLRLGKIKLQNIPLKNLQQDEIDKFFTLHTEWSKKKHVVGYPPYLLKAVFKCFAGHGTLHFAYSDKELVGALLVLYNGQIATYYTAISNKVGYSTFAPTLLTWEAIKYAQTNKLKIFDFGGTYDPRYPGMYKHWQGFTKFKSGFNPTPITYPPTALQLFW